jgi:RHS repeat-associated protein
MAGISSKAAGTLKNDKKYNSIELNEDLEVNTYDAFFRNLDPQIGRWWQVDPKIEWDMENWSTYNSNFNNPIRYDDPKGDCPVCWIPIVVGLLTTSTPANPPSSLPAQHRTKTASKNWDNAVHNQNVQVAGSFLLGSGKTILNVIDNTYNKLKAPVENKSSSTTEPQKAHPSNQGSGLGRGKNNRKPDENATGDHSVSNDRGSTTYQKNEKNPSGFQEVKRVDKKGKADNGIPTPHVHENGKVRTAKPEDIPKSDLSRNRQINQ